MYHCTEPQGAKPRDFFLLFIVKRLEHNRHPSSLYMPQDRLSASYSHVSEFPFITTKDQGRLRIAMLVNPSPA